MPNDLGSILNAFTKLGNTSQISLSSIERIVEMLKTDEGRTLVDLISQSSNNSLKTAAASAMNGDADSAKKTILEFLSTKEGTALASKLAGMFGNMSK